MFTESWSGDQVMQRAYCSRVINMTRWSVSLDNHASTLLCNFRLKISDTCSLFTIYKKIPENPVVMQMEHDFFGRSSGKFAGTTEHLKTEKIVPFYRTEYSKQKLVFHFFKPIFDTSFGPSWSFFGKWNWFVQMHGKLDSVKKFPSPEFCLPFA